MAEKIAGRSIFELYQHDPVVPFLQIGRGGAEGNFMLRMRFALLAMAPLTAAAACPSSSALLGTYQAEELQYLPDRNVRAVLATFTLLTATTGNISYYAAVESGEGGQLLEERTSTTSSSEQTSFSYRYSSSKCRGSIVAPGGVQYRFTVDGAGTLHAIAATQEDTGNKARELRAYRQ